MATSIGTELGSALGNSLKDSNNYKQDFVETEMLSNLQLVSLNSVVLRTSLFVYEQDIGDHFVLDHPVNGELDSSVFELDTGLGARSLFSSSEVQS